MDQQDKEHKKKYKVNNRPIISLLIGLAFFSAILFVTMFVASKESSKSNRANNKTPQKVEQEDALIPAESDGEMLAIVKGIDISRSQIMLYDVNRQETINLSFSGGTNITDKYDQVIAISQVQFGVMVDASYQPEKSKLTSMQISTKAWEYIGVSNLSIDRTAKTMKIATTKYKYTEGINILDGKDLIPVENLAQQDELTIRGYDETIWSITVTRGHGSVKLEDFEPFLGANITIGYETMQQITKDMAITVREGNYNLTVENGEYSATKNISINRNQETIVSLSDLGPEALRQGRITFEISPFGADLFIDNELISYANPLELTYGEHIVVVSLGGYTSYQGTVNVEAAGKIIKIDLPEVTSKEEVIISEIDTGVSDDLDTEDIDTGSEDTKDTSAKEEDIIDEDHLIYVQNPIGASIYLNGEFKGISPASFPKVIGTHVITFIEEGYITMSYTVDVPNDELDIYFTLPALLPTGTQ